MPSRWTSHGDSTSCTPTGCAAGAAPGLSLVRLKRPLLPPQLSKYQKMWVRTKSTVAMIGGFIAIIYAGHVPLMFLIFAIQVPSGAVPRRSDLGRG